MRIMRFCLALVLASIVIPGTTMAAPIRQTSANSTVIYVSQATQIQAAVSSVPNGGIIELAQGTYSLSGSLNLNNLHKGFTMRAAPGAQVILDGQNNHPVMTVINSSTTSGGPFSFQGITFANGYTTQELTAGGVTLFRAQATFDKCTFRSNVANVRTMVGGGVLVAESSRVFFFNSSWISNSNPVGGGGLGIRTNCQVYVHNSQFTGNTSISSDPNLQSSGGGINMGNATLRVSNTRFDSNKVGGHGAGLYVIGNWRNPRTTPTADAIVVNSTFVNNSAQHAAGVQNLFATQGGAVNVEDQSLLRIYNSRLISNNAMIGGGMNVFRAQAEVRNSVFLGNQATGPTTGTGYGGAIAANSADPSTPASSLILEDSLIQGRVAGTTVAAAGAGGLLIAGNGGSRGKAVINRVVFYDLDTTARNGSDSGVAGALEAAGADLTMQNSLVANCDTSGGDWASGGGLMIFNSTANIDKVGFYHNTAGWAGGAALIQGSALSLSNSTFVKNQVGAGAGGSAYKSYGAAIFTAPAESPAVPATGTVTKNVFTGNAGMAIFDDDRTSGPINDTRYNSNSFYETSFSDKVYLDDLTAYQNPVGLNSLVVTRAASIQQTDKSQSANSVAQSAIPAGVVLAVPAAVLPAGAAGDAAGPTTAYIAYASSAPSIQLDGSGVSNDTGLLAATAPGNHTLSYTGGSSTASVRQGATAAATLTASGSNTLSWHLTSGTFLDAALDREVTIAPGASGSVAVSGSMGTTYYYYAITQEGGAVDQAVIGVPVLDASDQVSALGAPNRTHPYASLDIVNAGGGGLSWSATAQGPDASRIHLAETSGECQRDYVVSLWIDVAGLATGVYKDYINVNGGAAGSLQVPITIRVVPQVRNLWAPIIR